MKYINEIHTKDYVTYSIIPRIDDGNPVTKRKIRKDLVTIRKLVSTSSRFTSPVIIYINEEGETVTVIADCNGLEDTRKLQILTSHNETRTFLALKTHVFKDSLTNEIIEIDYTQIRKILFRSEYFENIDAEMQQDSLMF